MERQNDVRSSQLNAIGIPSADTDFEKEKAIQDRTKSSRILIKNDNNNSRNNRTGLGVWGFCFFFFGKRI